MDDLNLLDGYVKDICDKNLVDDAQLLIEMVKPILAFGMAVVAFGSQEQDGPEEERASH